MRAPARLPFRAAPHTDEHERPLPRDRTDRGSTPRQRGTPDVTELFPFLLLALVFVVLIILPARQRKKIQQKQTEMQNSLTIGTPVMTTAGLHGTVAGLGDKTVDLEIAPGVVVTFARPAIMEVRRPVVETPPTGDDSPGAPGSSL